MANIWKQIQRWMAANVTKSGIFVGSPLIDYYLKNKSATEKKVPVYDKLVQGSQPGLIRRPHPIYRPDVMSGIKSRFLPQSSDEVTRFGLVIGPSGSGKSYAIKDFCNQFPEGMIYHEIVEPSSFVTSLSKELGMKTAPVTVLDLLLGYISERYTHYYVLPESQLISLDIVLNGLESVTMQFQQNKGKVPVLFIDGVDLLAKYDKELCCRLITHSKVMANEGKLKIVLVTSEGNIMPLLQALSAVNRAVTYEIGDVDNDKALQYLVDNGVAKDTGRRLVHCIGGRIVYLESCVFHMQIEDWSGENVCEKAKHSLFARDLNGQKLAITKSWPGSAVVLNALASDEYILPAKLVTENNPELDNVIKELIDANVLRYTHDGHVTWHGRIQKREFGKLSEATRLPL